MKTKTLLIPLAAFALTATSVSAFNPDILKNAGLSDEQVTAFETAHELKKEGDRDAARDVLAEAGVDLDTLEEVRNAMRAEREEHRAEVKAAVEAEDFSAFQAAVADTKLADKILTADDFEQLVQAHQLRAAGDHEAAKAIFADLEIEKPGHKGKGHGDRGDRGERPARN